MPSTRATLRVQMALRPAVVALAFATASAVPCSTVLAEIVWLAERTPHFSHSANVELWARARSGYAATEDLNARLVCIGSYSCRPQGGIYQKRFYRELAPTGFTDAVTARDTFTVPGLGTFMTSVHASQTTVLQPLHMESNGAISVEYRHAGGQDRHRGIAMSSAKLHFRVTGEPYYFVFDGEFTTPAQERVGRHGMMSIVPIKVAAGAVNEYFAKGPDPDLERTPVVKWGLLSPGTYRLQWWITADLGNRRIGDYSFKDDYRLRLQFHPCSQYGPMQHDSQSFDTEVEAAQAASDVAWQRTSADPDDAEFGGLIYKLAENDYRYVNPVKGWVDPKTNIAQIRSDDVQRAYARTMGPLACAEHRLPPAVAIYHTHPALLERAYLSFNDLNAAVGASTKNMPFSVYMRGATGERCGIHAYSPLSGHSVEKPVADRNGASGLCGLAGRGRTNAEKQEINDPRRNATRWLPLKPGIAPREACDSLANFDPCN